MKIGFSLIPILTGIFSFSVYAQSDISQLVLDYKNETFSDQAFFLFTTFGEIGTDTYDAYKLASLSNTYSEIYSEDPTGRKLSINTLPDSFSDTLEIPIYTNSTVSGTFNLSVSKYENLPENWSFTIKDLQNDSLFTLQQGTEYIFDIPIGRTERFILTLNPGIHSSSITIPGTSGKDSWHFLGSSTTNETFNDLLASTWTQGALESNAPEAGPNIFIWNESSRIFSPITDLSETISNGQGFVAYLFEDDDPNTLGIQGGWPKNFPSQGISGFGIRHFPISYSNSHDNTFQGFNLVANPYPFSIDWDSPGWSKTNIQDAIWVWDPNKNDGNGKYLEYINGVGDPIQIIAPNQAFWVRATSTNAELSADETIKSENQSLPKKTSSPPFITLTVEQNEFQDRHYISFREDSSQNVLQLQPISTKFLQLYSKIDSSNYAIHNQSLQFDSLVIPIESYSSFLGEHHISITKSANLYPELTISLYDPQTNSIVPFEEHSTYSFYSDSTHYPLFLVLKKTTSVSNEVMSELPSSIELDQNYPNPFNPSTNIAFGLPQSGKVTLQVFDLLGRKVATLLNGQNKTAGRHTISFDAGSLPSGMYIYRLQAGNTIIIKKLTLIK